MKTLRSIFVTIASCLLVTMCSAQKLVDNRDQAEGWYVPVSGEVMVAGKKTAKATIQVFKNNQEVAPAKTNKKGAFKVDLDINDHYALLISAPGANSELIHVDTQIPTDLVEYPGYFCYIDLEPKTSSKSTHFYMDFPAAIVRYDKQQGGFYHSEAYLHHIHEKLNDLAKAKEF